MEFHRSFRHGARGLAHPAQRAAWSLGLSLVARFAQRGGDKFTGLVWRRGIGGIPVLPDFAACFECGTEHRYDGGDHTIIVGRVLAFEDHEKEPLIVHRGRYFGNGGV